MQISEDVESVYSLEHILVEGQSRKSSGEASDGLEIELQSGDTTYDTLVMLNLGYYQLKVYFENSDELETLHLGGTGSMESASSRRELI